MLCPSAIRLCSRAARFYSISCSIHDRFGNNPYKQSFTFSRVINHEDYNPNTFANDISVMVLRNQPVENNYLQPVCVAVDDYYGGETSYVIGWGTLSEGKRYAEESRFKAWTTGLLLFYLSHSWFTQKNNNNN